MNKKEDSQQKTLFQCWNKKPDKQEQKSISNLPSNNNSKKRDSDEIILLDESDASFNQKTNNFENQDEDDFNANDLELIKASETMLTDKSRNSFANNATIASTSRAESSLLDSTTNRSSAQEQLLTVIDHGLYSSTTNTDTTGFDHNAGSVWIYPNNMPIRAYQYNIIQQCLYNNTMVVLPTGLGKTFVAAVVMLNFYRWYPNGKIIFMAPTKPLVNQQSDACCKIVGITKTDMCQLTGQMNPDKRKALWTNKRVFFLTPQVISNDILRGNVDVSMIKLVVIDEAHKALGEYAFCKVIESINETNKNFRVLALTATPGSDAKTVQGIINSLLISHIELRSDDSIDIQQYNHGRQVAKFILKLEGEILQIKNAYLNVMKSPLKRLEINRIVTNKDPNSLSKLFILDRRDQFRKNPPSGLDQKKCGFIESDFALLISMIHALELLTQYGVKSFYMFIKSFIENTDNSKSSAQQTKFKNEIMANDEMAQWFNKFKESFDNKASIVPKELRHPKLIKLEEVIIEHFNKFDKNNTRVMIFSQYRESVYEITEMLAAHSEIKAMEFVGQSGVNGTHKTVTQKEQLEVVKKFRDGGYNTLVSTCVGEEGLDIGEVDLIICYDSQKSPIRLIQRMGRTGRKREGRIVILLTEGKEVASYECSLSKKKNIYRVIQNGAKNFKFYQNNPLMIPRNIRPTCHKIFISAPISDNEDETSSKKKSKKKSLDYDNQDEDDDGNDEENLNKTKKTANRKSKTISTDNESGSENKPVQKRKRQSKNTTKLDDPESKVTKRKNAKKSTLITSELSNDGFSTQGPTQLPELDLRFSTDTVTKNVDFNLDNEEEEDDEDLKFLKNTNSNLLDVMSTSITSNKSLNDSKNSKNSQTESNKNSNDIEQMIIDETVAFITEESNESSSRKSASPLAISNPNRFAATIEESMLITQKSNINETNENNKPKLVIEDTFAMSCNSSSSSAKSTSTIDQIIDDVINQAEMEKDKENSLETIKTTEPAKFNLIDKRFSHLKKSPIGEQNSTSTPMRSILKNKTPLLNNINENNISYSPLILSQAITEQNTKLNKESNLSMIGMTQALDILSTCPVTPKSKITINSTSELGALPFKFYFKSPDIISFEMKTDLLDLFKEESDESKLHNNSVRFSSVKVKNALNQESIICIDSNMDTDLKDSKKRLRFDESPQKNDQYDVPIDDESIIQMKRVFLDPIKNREDLTNKSLRPRNRRGRPSKTEKGRKRGKALKKD